MTLAAVPALTPLPFARTAPMTPADASVGLSWVPYLLAGLALCLIAVVAHRRARVPGPGAGRVEFWVVRVTLLGLIGFTALLLADAASEGDGLTAADRPVWSWLVDHRTATLTVIARVVTEVGSTLVVTILAIAAAGLLLLRHRQRDQALLVLLVTAGAGLLVVVSKPIVGRVRPPEEFRLVTETNQSFPSGHALASVAVLGVLAAVFLPTVSPTWARRAGYGAVVVAVAAIGVSRLYLGVHWATDVAGGWLVGGGWLLLCLTGWQFWTHHRGVKTAAAGEPRTSTAHQASEPIVPSRRLPAAAHRPENGTAHR